MKKTYLIGALALTLCACSGQPKEENGVIKVDIENAQPLKLSDLVESITLIPLETTDESLVKDINKMKVRDGKFYFTNQSKNVLAFDKNGKFLMSTASRVGEGPEDYYFAFSIDVANDGLLSIFEGLLPRIREYDSNLKLQKTYFMNAPDSTRSSQEMRLHVKIDEDLYLLRDPGYTYYYSVSQDSIIQSRQECDEGNKCALIASNLRFLKNEGEIYFSPTYICDTLYRVNTEKRMMEPVVVYDLGDHKLDYTQFPDDMNFQYYVDLIMTSDKVFIQDKIHFSNADYAFATCIANKENYVVHRNKQGIVTTYQCKEGGLYAPLDVYEDHFVYAMWPYQLKENLDKVPMLKELLTKESLELIQHLEDEDNPVIMLYRLKK